MEISRLQSTHLVKEHQKKWTQQSQASPPATAMLDRGGRGFWTETGSLDTFVELISLM